MNASRGVVAIYRPIGRLNEQHIAGSRCNAHRVAWHEYLRRIGRLLRYGQAERIRISEHAPRGCGVQLEGTDGDIANFRLSRGRRDVLDKVAIGGA